MNGQPGISGESSRLDVEQALQGAVDLRVGGPACWTTRRWLVTIIAVFLLHLALLSILSDRPGPPRPPSIEDGRLVLAADPGSARQLAEAPWLDDPTLFALPSAQGFSGEAWLKPRRQPFVPPDSEPAADWLALDRSWLGSTFSRYVGESISAPIRVADQPLPRAPLMEPKVDQVPLATRSNCRLEGALDGRALISRLEPESWPSQEILTNSVVELLVDANGYALTAALLASSGSKPADAHALELARKCRFAPVGTPGSLTDPPGPIATGRIVFEWITVPPLQPTQGTPF